MENNGNYNTFNMGNNTNSAVNYVINEPNDAINQVHGADQENPSSSSSVRIMRLATNWSMQEQRILEEGLSKYRSETMLMLYAHIAKDLPHKTTRDVAVRCQWTKMQREERQIEEEAAAAS